MMAMKRWVAAFLLWCLGMMIPAVASPLRFCLIDGSTHPLGLLVDGGKSKCCDDCTPESEDTDPCCVELEQPPDASIPQIPAVLPAQFASDLPLLPWLIRMPVDTALTGPVVARPIRGPTSPAAYRAILEVWRM
jgi:hypothetical protein